MSQPTLEERLTTVERQLSLVMERLLRMEAGTSQEKDWRSTIGMFRGDPDLQEVFEEAMKLREADRDKARQKAERKASNRS